MNEALIGFFTAYDAGVMATTLTLISAVSHAIFGAINKGGEDPYLNRGAINICYSIVALPLVVFVFPPPPAYIFGMLAVTYFIHFAYEWLAAASYVRGDFTLVYPIARGTSPLIAAALAFFVFSERFEASQWFGLVLLSGSIISLAWANLRLKQRSAEENKKLIVTIAIAVLTGVMVALFTVLDAYGIRLSGDPFTFLAWFFFFGGFGFPIVAINRLRKMAVQPSYTKLAIRGFIGTAVALSSFGGLMLATWLGSVSEAAALRETSIIFATIIGVLIFKEKLDLTRIIIIILIVVGAIMVKFTF